MSIRLLAPTGFLGAALAGLTCLWAGTAAALPPQVNISTDSDSSTAATGGPFAFMGNLSRSNYALGDLFGVRPLLSRYGMTLTILETSELFGNATGGVHKGVDYDGLTQVTLQLDTQRAFGWHGGLFNVSALQYHGRSLSADNLYTLQTSSGIQADRATRLWELWYQQKFLDEDRLDVKIGQQSLDQEFMVTQNGLFFVNTMFGWPLLPSYDLPGGGPAYPLSALGVRVRAKPFDAITILAGVFNGSPVVHNYGDPQMRNPSGTSFPLNGGVLAIAEVQFAYPSLGTMVRANETEPLARTYKIGAWYDSEGFSDYSTDNTGLSLNDPNSSGTSLGHHGNFSIYAVADQMVWRSFDEPDRNINVFIRAMGAPQTDRNLIALSLNAGVTFHEPFLGRDDDTAALGMGYGRVGTHARAFDASTGAFSGSTTIRRSDETFIEATYQYAATPWLQLQPDIQYVFNPGAGLQNPNTGARIKNELVLGVRTNILF